MMWGGGCKSSQCTHQKARRSGRVRSDCCIHRWLHVLQAWRLAQRVRLHCQALHNANEQAFPIRYSKGISSLAAADTRLLWLCYQKNLILEVWQQKLGLWKRPWHLKGHSLLMWSWRESWPSFITLSVSLLSHVVCTYKQWQSLIMLSHLTYKIKSNATLMWLKGFEH